MECLNCRLSNHTANNCVVTDEDIILLEKCKNKILLKQNKINDNKNKLFHKDNSEINEKIKKFENIQKEIILKYDKIYHELNLKKEIAKTTQDKQNNVPEPTNANLKLQNNASESTNANLKLQDNTSEPTNENLKLQDKQNENKTDEPLYKCLYCDKKFTTKNGANYHGFKFCKNNPKLKQKSSNNNEQYYKKTIPISVKRQVWNNYVGEEIGKSKCYCCKLTEITQMNFNAGHIISEKNGGEINANNLRPICQSCNSSMGIMNMDEYIQKYNLHDTLKN